MAFISTWSDSSCVASLIVLSADLTVVDLGVVVDKVVVVVVAVVVLVVLVVVVFRVVCRLLFCPPVDLLATAAAALLEARSLWVKEVMVITKTLVLNIAIKSIAIL